MDNINLANLPQEFWIALGVSLVIYLLFLLKNVQVLRSIPPQFRKINPLLILLMFIPIINLIFQFIWVHWLFKSLFNYYYDKNWPTKHLNVSYNLGMGFSIFSILNLIPSLMGISSFIATILLIAYWIQLYKINQQIKAGQQS